MTAYIVEAMLITENKIQFVLRLCHLNALIPFDLFLPSGSAYIYVCCKPAENEL
jgi:hypothetical protein